ncbi:hypothetical protein SUGI_0425860 [Cryptomeria japonica]|nr:hypothetical protein SUGI_0425860 [Cryptomeria japonica]
MAKGIYMFLMFLSLTAPLAFASRNDSHLNKDPAGYCSIMSGGFHGGCMFWRNGECNSVCEYVDHQAFGGCDPTMGGSGGEAVYPSSRGAAGKDAEGRRGIHMPEEEALVVVGWLVNRVPQLQEA